MLESGLRKKEAFEDMSVIILNRYLMLKKILESEGFNFKSGKDISDLMEIALYCLEKEGSNHCLNDLLNSIKTELHEILEFVG